MRVTLVTRSIAVVALGMTVVATSAGCSRETSVSGIPEDSCLYQPLSAEAKDRCKTVASSVAILSDPRAALRSARSGVDPVKSLFDELERLHDSYGLAFFKGRLAIVAAVGGKLDDADRMSREALDATTSHREVAYRLVREEALAAQAVVLAERHDTSAALMDVAEARKTIGLSDAKSVSRRDVIVLRAVASVLKKLGRDKEHRATLEQVVDVSLRSDNPSMAVISLLDLSLEIGDPKAAADYRRRAHDIACKNGRGSLCAAVEDAERH